MSGSAPEAGPEPRARERAAEASKRCTLSDNALGFAPAHHPRHRSGGAPRPARGDVLDRVPAVSRDRDDMATLSAEVVVEPVLARAREMTRMARVAAGTVSEGHTATVPSPDDDGTTPEQRRRVAALKLPARHRMVNRDR